ncbi:hypothetical protein ACXX84_02325 [Mycoplasma sp. AC157]
MKKNLFKKLLPLGITTLSSITFISCNAQESKKEEKNVISVTTTPSPTTPTTQANPVKQTQKVNIDYSNALVFKNENSQINWFKNLKKYGFTGIQYYATNKFFGLIGLGWTDNEIFVTREGLDIEKIRQVIIPSNPKEIKRYRDASWDEATSTLIFKYKVRDDETNKEYSQTIIFNKPVDENKEPENKTNIDDEKTTTAVTTNKNPNNENPDSKSSTQNSEEPATSKNDQNLQSQGNSPEPTQGENPQTPSDNSGEQGQSEPAVTEPTNPKNSDSEEPSENNSIDQNMYENALVPAFDDWKSRFLNKLSSLTNPSFKGLQYYSSSNFIGILGGNRREDNKIFVAKEGLNLSQIKRVSELKGNFDNVNKFPSITNDAVYDASTKILTFKYKIEGDSTNKVYTQTFDLNESSN